MRHALHTRGLCYCFNAVMCHVVLGVLYRYRSPDHENYNVMGNYTGAHHQHWSQLQTSLHHVPPMALARSTISRSLRQVGTLSAVWPIAFVGSLLTMKREYVGTFMSLQTGCDYSQSSNIYCKSSANQWHWHWLSIRDLVRQWVSLGTQRGCC